MALLFVLAPDRGEDLVAFVVSRDPMVGTLEVVVGVVEMAVAMVE